MSGATARRRGHTWERHLAGWLRDQGVHAVTSRQLADGYQAGADLVTDLPVALEAKNHARLDLAGWVDQARHQADGLPAAVIVKRRGKADPGEAYVVMTATDWLALLRSQEGRP